MDHGTKDPKTGAELTYEVTLNNEGMEDNVDEEEPSPLGVSLFLRHVPLSVPASMVEELGRRCEGFQRVALGQVTFKGDGQPMRKAWITYDPTTDIKQVCNIPCPWC